MLISDLYKCDIERKVPPLSHTAVSDSNPDAHVRIIWTSAQFNQNRRRNLSVEVNSAKQTRSVLDSVSVPETLFTLSARRLPRRRENLSSSMLFPLVQQFTARPGSLPQPLRPL